MRSASAATSARPAGFSGYRGRSYYIWKERYEKHGVAGLRDLPRETTQYPVSYSTRDRVADPSHSGRASLRRRSSQPLSATALSRLRVTDDYPEDLSSSSRWPRFAEKVSSRPKTTGCTLAGSWPLCPTGCEVRSPRADQQRRQRFYRFKAIDEATQFRVLRIYDHDNTKTAIDFLREVPTCPSRSRFRKFRPITALRSGHSSPGTFPTCAFPTNTYLRAARR